MALRLKTALAERKASLAGKPGKTAGDEKPLREEQAKSVVCQKRTKLTPAEMEETIVSHYESGKRLAWSFLLNWRMRMNQDEVASVVGAALCEAAHRFDPSKEVKFKTFFFYHLRGMLLKEMARIIQEQKLVQCFPVVYLPGNASPDHVVLSNNIFPLVDNNNPERMMVRREVASICWDACSHLDKLEREVVLRHFVYDEPLIDIANDLNYCRCHVSRVKSRALKKLERAVSGILRPFRRVEEPEEVKDEPAAQPRAAKPKVYTGGRGRRRQKQSEIGSEIDSLRRKAVNY